MKRPGKKHVTSVLLVGLLTACRGSLPAPLPMPPPQPVARAGDPLPLLLGIVTLEEQRPETERGTSTLHELRGRGNFHNPYFWYFRGQKLQAPEGTLALERNPRVTGDGAFLWYPFPRSGSLSPANRPATEGISDFLALVAEWQGIASRVARFPSQQAALQAGADLVLEGTLEHFAAVFLHRPWDTNRPADDTRLHDLFSLVQLNLRLSDAAGSTVWEERLVHDGSPHEEHLFDTLEWMRDSQIRELLVLDQADMPGYTYTDMVRILLRHLSRFALSATNSIEVALGGVDPPAPAPPEDPESS